MKKIYSLWLLAILSFLPLKSFSWPGMPLPPLHVDGRYLKDDCGNIVNLHGVAITPHPWFNGCMYGFGSKYCTWDNYDVEGALKYNKAVMDKLTNTDEGWYLTYIRLHVDPYWTNDPGPPLPENDISRFNYDRLVQYTDEVIVPLVEHAKERGLYVILRPPGVCPERIAVDDEYHEYLKTIWTFLSDHPGLKNVDHVMFELANEPVEILGTNGVYGKFDDPHFEALNNFFQPITDIIRNNGADNIIWIPGSGWQSHYQGYVKYPITGGNIGYAVHIYPGYWGGVRNYQAFQNGWNEHVKPIADIAPIAITETDWAPEGYGAFGVGITGTVGGEGFGANLNYIAKQSGNVSWNLLSPDNLIDHGDPNAGIAYDGDWQACAAPAKQWFREYAAYNIPACELVQNGVYEIEFATDPSIVLELVDGTKLSAGARGGVNTQRWRAEKTEDGYWKLVSMAKDVEGNISLLEGNMEAGAAIGLLPGDEAGAEQEWQINQLEDGYYEVLSRAALDATLDRGWELSNCESEDDQYLQINDNVGSPCQKFKFKLIPNDPDNSEDPEEEDPVTGIVTDEPHGIMLYPNPATNGAFFVNIPSSGNYELAIFTVEGREIYVQRNLASGVNRISTGLNAGVYIVRISANHYSAALRLVIN